MFRNVAKPGISRIVEDEVYESAWKHGTAALRK